jgi:hypothetical protein
MFRPVVADSELVVEKKAHVMCGYPREGAAMFLWGQPTLTVRLLLLAMLLQLVGSSNTHRELLRSKYSAQISALQSNQSNGTFRHSAAVGHRVDKNMDNNNNNNRASGQCLFPSAHQDHQASISIDAERQTVMAFQDYSMETLFDACVAHNLLPKVYIHIYVCVSLLPILCLTHYM